MAKPGHITPKRRKVFRFYTQEAKIRRIRYGGKRCIIRVLRCKKDALRDFYRHSIFHTLFPQYSLKPLGVSSIRKSGDITKFGMVSEILKKRSPDYKKYQYWFYENRLREQYPQEALRHEKFVEEIAKPIASHIQQISGIALNDHPVNVANIEGVPVFFEIDDIAKKQFYNYLTNVISGAIEQSKMKMLHKWIAQL